MTGYLRRLIDAYRLTAEEAERHEKGRRLWVLFDETGYDVAVGDCVECTKVAWKRGITIQTIH